MADTSFRPDYILAADMGGTKTNISVYDSKADERNPLLTKSFRNREFASFEVLLGEFLQTLAEGSYVLSMGVAGPVDRRRAELTNINWVIEEEQIEKNLGLQSVWLLNDLKAGAEAIEILNEDELWTIMEGRPDAEGSIAVIAPGTGLGEGYITFDQGRAKTHACEGGHTDFAPRNDQQAGLLRFLMDKYEHISVERVCSGIGIPEIYEYLYSSGQFIETAEHHEELQNSHDKNPIIFSHAMDESETCVVCEDVLRIFLEVLGAEAGNLALKIGAKGGVYIGGGIPPKIRRAFESEHFKKAFLDKGRHKDYMEQIPVRMILNSESPLLGAAHYAFKKIDDLIQE